MCSSEMNQKQVLEKEALGWWWWRKEVGFECPVNHDSYGGGGGGGGNRKLPHCESVVKPKGCDTHTVAGGG